MYKLYDIHRAFDVWVEILPWHHSHLELIDRWIQAGLYLRAHGGEVHRLGDDSGVVRCYIICYWLTKHTL